MNYDRFSMMPSNANYKMNIEQNKPKKKGNQSQDNTNKYLVAANMVNNLNKTSTGDQDSTTSVVDSTLSGAAAGSTVGGGWGAGIGAAVGLTSGLLQARANKKQKEREAKAAHYLKVAQIEQDKANRLQQAYASMAANIGATLRSV